jgi:hypothetical protein
VADLQYLDFDLSIDRTANGYRAQVVSSPAGQAAVEFALPFSDLELENFLLKLGGRRRNTRAVVSPELETAKAFGGRLFQTIFADELRGCLRSSLDEADQQGQGLRLRLRLNNAPALADLPWEYLYNASSQSFLALSNQTPIVRFLDLPAPPRTLKVTGPLRMLVMIASPSDYTQLNVDHEWNNLQQATGDLQARGILAVERMDEATLPALQRRLRQGRYHILHFIGHGSFDERMDDGALILEDENGKGCVVSGQYLGTILRDHESLRLVLLNACEGARSGTMDPFAGVAQSLIRQGIPAVIAMQFEVTDDAAIVLAHEFYGAIADRYPVDAALAEARKAIFASGNGIEWGTPVLYLRAPDGCIFDIAPRDPATETGALVAPAASIVAQPRPAPLTDTLRKLWSAVIHPPSVTRGIRNGITIGVMVLVALLIIAGGIWAIGLDDRVWRVLGVQSASCEVIANGLNVREGPSVEFDRFRTLVKGTEITPLGRADNGWLSIRMADGRSGWVNGASSFVRCGGDMASVPVVGERGDGTVGFRASPGDGSAGTGGPPAAAGEPPTAADEREVQFANVSFAVTRAAITAGSIAEVDITVRNSSLKNGILLGSDMVKLRLQNGQEFADESGWSVGLYPPAPSRQTLKFTLPPGATLDGAALVIEKPDREPAVIRLDGAQPDPEYPKQLRTRGEATADLLVFTIRDAALELDLEGERVERGQRYLRLSLRVLSRRTGSGGVLISNDTFRLWVGRTPIAPAQSMVEPLYSNSTVEGDVVFEVPADLTTAELEVGSQNDDRARIKLDLRPQE